MNFLTPEEKVAARVKRREERKLLPIVKPSDHYISSYAQAVCGPILRFMFPTSGNIKAIHTSSVNKVRNGYRVHITISSANDAKMYSFNVTSAVSVINDNFPIKPNECLTVSITPIDNEDEIHEMWTSVVWSN